MKTMKLASKNMLSVAVLAATVSPSLAMAEGLDEFLTALGTGKTNLELRLRTEWVDDTAPKKKEAVANTLRTVLGYRTADYYGFTGLVEFENISNFGESKYNNGLSSATAQQKQYATIADPALTQVNQSYVDGYGFRFGRQKVVFDNARFVGDVGWRQNDQTFDGLTYVNKVNIPATTVSLAYITKVNPPSGVTRRVKAPMANVRYSKVFENSGITASGFYYAVEEQDTVTVGATTTSPATSFQHLGFRVEGSVGDALYEASYAKQSKYQDATNAGTKEGNYYDLQLGYKLGPVTIKAQHEVLDPGFKTPLATLHAFNGWADRFLTTPTNGLEDNNIKLLARYWGLNFVLAAHDFKGSDTIDKTKADDFGTEIDFSVAKPITRNLNVMVKAAKYDASNRTSLVGTTANSDLTKAWIQVGYKF